MSLRERLVRCAERKTSPQHRPLLFPVSCVEDFLSDNPILVALQVGVREAHRALLDVDRKCTQWAPEGEGAEKRGESREERVRFDNVSLSSLTVHTSGCIECGGYIETDFRGGDRVCIRCGLVQDRFSINVNPEYVAPVDTVERVVQSTNILKGVGKCATKAACRTDGEKGRSRHWSLMEHLNIYAKLPMDDLIRMDKFLAVWHDGVHSTNARITAVLLYLPLSKHFPHEETVRKRVRLGEEVEAVRSIQPKASFACEACGRGFHMKRDARLCCKKRSWGGKRK